MITNRPIVESDFPKMQQEISAEQCHREWMTPAFFSEQGTISRVYEEDGEPIMYVRLSSALRVHIQFCKVDKDKIRRALITGFPDVVQQAKRSGYKQIIYDTASRVLAFFCRRYLGFVDSPEERVLWLEQLPITSLESSTCTIAPTPSISEP